MPAPRASTPPYRAQLALLVEDAPEGADWLHEVKYDGYRIGCAIEGGRVALRSRRGHDWVSTVPLRLARLRRDPWEGYERARRPLDRAQIDAAAGVAASPAP